MNADDLPFFIEIDGDAEDPFGPCWAVLDPRHSLHKLFTSLIGLDALPLIDALPRHFEGRSDPGFKVNHRRLTPDQLAILCRHVARTTKPPSSFEEIFYSITLGQGLVVTAPAVHVCPDPEIGRAWWRAIAEADKAFGRSPQQ
jgi:hypothetical protein